MEWSIDLSVLMLVLGLSALLVLPRPELAQVRLPYGWYSRSIVRLC